MEISELQKIWKDADLEIHQKSKEELNFLLAHVTRQTINKFLFITGAGILTAAGLIIFLVYTSLNRKDDMIYLINNMTLGIISLISIVAGLVSWTKLHSRKPDQSLKTWLEMRITHLSKIVYGKSGKLYYLILPVIYLLTILSIHVYFENKPFLEVLDTEESIIGLIAGIPIGLAVSILAVRKIRKKESINLEFLKDMYDRLCMLVENR